MLDLRIVGQRDPQRDLGLLVGGTDQIADPAIPRPADGIAAGKGDRRLGIHDFIAHTGVNADVRRQAVFQHAGHIVGGKLGRRAARKIAGHQRIAGVGSERLIEDDRGIEVFAKLEFDRTAKLGEVKCHVAGRKTAECRNRDPADVRHHSADRKLGIVAGLEDHPDRLVRALDAARCGGTSRHHQGPQSCRYPFHVYRPLEPNAHPGSPPRLHSVLGCTRQAVNE